MKSKTRGLHWAKEGATRTDLEMEGYWKQVARLMLATFETLAACPGPLGKAGEGGQAARQESRASPG